MHVSPFSLCHRFPPFSPTAVRMPEQSTTMPLDAHGTDTAVGVARVEKSMTQKLPGVYSGKGWLPPTMTTVWSAIGIPPLHPAMSG